MYSDKKLSNCSSLAERFAQGTNSFSVREKAKLLYEIRIGERKDASSIEWLNDLMRNGALELGHIDNEMYCDLLEGKLSSKDLKTFLDAYYWGSGYGFQRVVLPLAAKRKVNDVWKSYIKDIIYEENTPSSHCGIFKEFIENIGVELSAMPRSAERFIESMNKGYQNNLDYALGYALGIETEADFQIALIYISLARVYEPEVNKTSFFEIHLDEYGEEMHAQETCQCIEAILVECDGKRECVEEGFRQAIIDTMNYMHDIKNEIVKAKQPEMSL
ncbi:hypothetical protein [Chitinibacter sp. ZOR0017]|uniref:hypothetical protein n=1 Tax=Chitinibacter sp. ZOR0017 TaxID=1339254 RepID=UPI0009DE1D64|nr:hypothetical protein [Chitinibacter sp. ZOR0017]